MAVAGGIWITTLSIWMLGMLNLRAINAHVGTNARSVMVRSPETEIAPPDAYEPEPEPEPPPDEIMEIDMDMDMPTPPVDTVEPLDLDMAVPAPILSNIQLPTRTAHTPTVTGARDARKVDQPPRESGGNPNPVYPADKRQNGLSGTVKVRLLIDETGRVEDAEVISGDEAFVRAVMEVVHQWRFTPARHEGRPVKVWGVKRVSFRVNE